MPPQISDSDIGSRLVHFPWFFDTRFSLRFDCTVRYGAARGELSKGDSCAGAVGGRVFFGGGLGEGVELEKGEDAVDVGRQRGFEVHSGEEGGVDELEFVGVEGLAGDEGSCGIFARP